MIFAERKRRFALLLKNYKNQQEAGDALGLGSVSQVSNLKTGEKSMGEEIARRLEQLADVPKGYFVNPLEGESNLSETTVNSSQTDTIGPVTLNATNQGDSTNIDRTVRIQDYSDWVSSTNEKLIGMSVSHRLLVQKGIKAEDLKSIEISDDSNTGFLNRGAAVAINVNFESPIKNGSYYAIALGGVVTIRLIDYQFNNDIYLRCNNDAITDQLVPASEVQSLDIRGIAVAYESVLPT